MNQSEVMGLIQEAKSLPVLVAMLKHNDVDSALHDWAVRRYLDVRARERGVPLKGTFEITPLCNLDCKMCYVHLNAEQLGSAELLSAEQWKRIMAEAIDAGMMYATITGGECLIHPDFDELYLYLHGRGVQITVFTNGVMLSDDRIAFFKAHPPAQIQVTLYGMNEVTYEQVTGRRVFDCVKCNMTKAIEAKLPLLLAITPNRYLGNDNESLLRYVIESGVPFRLNTILMTPRSETGRDDGFKDLSYDDYIHLLKLKRELVDQVVLAECSDDLIVTEDSELTESPKGLRCGAGRSGFKVTWDGKLVPCDKLMQGAVSLREEPFIDGWNKIHRFAEEFKLPIECEKCPYASIARGCPAEHHKQSGHADLEQCKWCKALYKAGFLKNKR